MTSYRLHYAPDNASLAVRLALEEMGLPHDTVLVDRRARAQRSAAYLAINPAGRIPALEGPDGAMFETAAILLWLADRHGALAPAPDAPGRAAFLSHLFFVSNTLHAEMRMMFYPGQYVDGDTARRALREGLPASLTRHLAMLDRAASAGTAGFAPDRPSVLGLYLACCLRWCALYPAGGTGWFRLSDTPALSRLAAGIEAREGALRAAAAEGLGPTPFTAPILPDPPEGSAT
ncbi:glutathione S-transferase family protein [Roseivivax sediminis]|uniref:Glutathione S-transferase n=1 Tax=Roseivivax sediminis TaxID=936889 RepID=A0A1I1SUN7_9RHOB|nr:glutathione S-transferase family protein [Roseivivax sediminis]SFD50062.1 glutathione S-transferase [Roseivivax sediminis]